jgi:site-specific DNA-adenine methylase
MKRYKKSPLPFQGQKRNFIKEFEGMIKELPDNYIVVDLFGGSGLLSHTAKQVNPNLRVIYNDFDGFRDRLEEIPRTNKIVSTIKSLVESAGIPRSKKIPDHTKEEIDKYLKEENNLQPIDVITISSSLVFSGKVASDLSELEKQTYYNNTISANYNCDNYLDGLEISQKCYRELVREFGDCDNVLFIADPPYLSTEAGNYKSTYWKLGDFLDVLTEINGRDFIFFTSSKSNLIELCEWIDKIYKDSPIKGAKVFERGNRVNWDCNAGYTDYLIYKRK